MSISLHQIRSALLLSLWVIAPWIFGIFYGQAMFGTLMSFGAYLLVVSYPKLPKKIQFPYYYKGLGFYLSLQSSGLMSL
ncbi:hypothetical protein AB6H14_09095 [Providencia vermicola]